MASIERRRAPDGTRRYRVKVRRQGTPPQTATFARLSEAKAWAQQTEGALALGRHFPQAPQARLTLGDLLARYTTDVLPQESRSAQQNKRTHLTWWQDALGTVLLRDLTPHRLAAARDRLAQTHAPGTVNRYLTTLARVCTLAVREWQVLDVSPLARVARRREPRGRVRYLTPDERARLLLACQQSANPSLTLIVILALSTGARAGELLGLRWRDVDLPRGQVTFQQTKNQERRTVPVTGLALNQLGDLAAARPQALQNDYLFASQDGQRPADIRTAWQAARRRAGLTDFRFHDLRHSAASYLAMSGASLLEIAAILGHKTLQMTVRYSHLSEAHTRQVAARMTQQIFGAGAERAWDTGGTLREQNQSIGEDSTGHLPRP